ncbi:MAG: hypothetical protein AAFU67_16935 [Bacteroidota bacterium]
MPKGTLIIYRLSIATSLDKNREEVLPDRFDVIEWWITDEIAYRIKTFRLSRAIHLWIFETSKYPDILQISQDTTENNYGDVISHKIIIPFKEEEPMEEAIKVFQELGMSGQLEVGKYVFWNPDGRKYRVKKRYYL